MKLAITGSSGAGKTTLAKALSTRLNIPLINEDFSELIRAITEFERGNAAFTKPSLLAALQQFDEWLKRRAMFSSKTDCFIEDRFCFDALQLMMSTKIGGLRPDVIQQLITLANQQSSIYDLVIVLPIGSFSFNEHKNEDGLKRKNSFCEKIRSQSTTIGLLEQFCLAPRVYINASCKTTAQRLDYVMQAINQ